MYAVDNQFELSSSNGTLSFGPSFQSEPNWAGLIGPAGATTSMDLRESRSTIARTDGEISGAGYWGNRSIVLDILIPYTDPAQRGRVLKRIYKVCDGLINPKDGYGWLTWTEKDGREYGLDPQEPISGANPAFYSNTPKTISVRLQSYPEINHNGDPTKSIQIVLTARQPFAESVFPPPYSSFTLSKAFETGISSYTLEPPLMQGTGTSYPVISVDGPIRSFTMTSGGSSLSYSDGTISGTPIVSAGKYLEISCRPDQRTVKLWTYSGSSWTWTNLFDKLSAGSTFPSTGPTTFSSITGATTATQFGMKYRWAWL